MEYGMCSSCEHLNKDEKVIADNPRFQYMYGCGKNGHCCGWLENDNDLKYSGCSNWEEKGNPQLEMKL